MRETTGNCPISSLSIGKCHQSILSKWFDPQDEVAARPGAVLDVSQRFRCSLESDGFIGLDLNQIGILVVGGIIRISHLVESSSRMHNPKKCYLIILP